VILYRVRLRQPERGWCFMGATGLRWGAVWRAHTLVRDHPREAVRVEAEEWPTLSPLKYLLYVMSRRAGGFGLDFQRKHCHKHRMRGTIWPQL